MILDLLLSRQPCRCVLTNFCRRHACHYTRSRINVGRRRPMSALRRRITLTFMPLQNALAREATSSCNPETFGFSSALSGHDVVIRTFSLLRPWSAGLLLTLIQLVVAVFLLAPDGPLSYRYTSLVQHDGYWFANIVVRGYQTIVPH